MVTSSSSAPVDPLQGPQPLGHGLRRADELRRHPVGDQLAFRPRSTAWAAASSGLGKASRPRPVRMLCTHSPSGAASRRAVVVVRGHDHVGGDHHVRRGQLADGRNASRYASTASSTFAGRDVVVGRERQAAPPATRALCPPLLPRIHSSQVGALPGTARASLPSRR